MTKIKLPNTLTLPRCEFLAAEATAQNAGVRRATCRLVARSAEAVNIPWAGPVVHDFAGLRTPPARLNVDYCHDPA